MSQDQTEEFTYAELQALKRHARQQAIEECARVVLEYDKWPRHRPIVYEDAVAVAAAIRALKDKP